MASDADQPPPLFDGKPFRYILSLGGNCEPAHELRRTGRYEVKGLFDWLVAPLDSVIAILADDGARLATRFMAANAGTSARCAEYGVLYHHEFPRGDGDVILFDRRAVVQCRRKMRAKYRSFVQCCSGPDPVLFVRVWPQTDLAWDRLGPAGSPAGAQDLNELACAIANRFPQLDFGLLAVTLAGDTTHDFKGVLDPRIELCALERQSAPGWYVSDSDWDRLLARVAHTPQNASVDISETLYWF